MGILFLVRWNPLAILTIIVIICLAFGRMPHNTSTQAVLTVIIVSITVFNVFVAPLPIKTEGWQTERISTLGVVQITEDGQYEYFLEIINSSQSNSSARLFVRNIATGEEMKIPLDMKNKKITIYLAHTTNEMLAWSHLVPSEISQSIYSLTTTEHLNKEIETFEIDMETKTSRRIE